uniref:t-SNARE coiled-coil homology domain-containing protein n=2 Tax=Hemiselmis andersenii TaxID=464988 RepID=A0A6T8PI17_HEMAN
MQLQAPLLDDGQVSFAMQSVMERNEEMRQLETDLGELHTLFKDVATLASMQQENLDTIEGAVTEANVRVVGGVSELLKAKKHQRRARKRMCCLIATGACVVTILAYWIIGPR